MMSTRRFNARATGSERTHQRTAAVRLVGALTAGVLLASGLPIGALAALLYGFAVTLAVVVVYVVGIDMRRVLRDLWGLGTTEFGWTVKTDDGSFNGGILKTPIIDHTDEADALAALVSEFGQRSGSQPK